MLENCVYVYLLINIFISIIIVKHSLCNFLWMHSNKKFCSKWCDLKMSQFFFFKGQMISLHKQAKTEDFFCY